MYDTVAYSRGIVRRYILLGLGVLVTAFALALFMSQGAFAATKTWNGEACDLDINDCGWSVDDNWADDSAPINGDDIVIDVMADNSRADITNLNIASLTFTNSTTSAQIYTLRVENPLIVSGDIDTGTVGDLISINLDDTTLTLGAPVTVTGSGTFNIVNYGVSTANQLALGGNSLSFELTGATATVEVPITGNGTVNANTSGIINALNLEGVNTYSGVTNVNGAVNTDGPTPFGTSTVNIATLGSVIFSNDSNTTISNQINMAGSSTINGLSFQTLGTGVTYTVPNIVMNGNARFALSTGVVSVDLTGITTNNFCATYFGNGDDITDGPGNGFIGGPAGCIYSSPDEDDIASSSSGSTPKAPDTGFGLVNSNPILVGALSLTITVVLIALGRKLRVAAKG